VAISLLICHNWQIAALWLESLSSRAQRGDLSFSIKPKDKSEIATPPFRMPKLVVVKPRGFAMTKGLSSRAKRGDLSFSFKPK